MNYMLLGFVLIVVVPDIVCVRFKYYIAFATHNRELMSFVTIHHIFILVPDNK